MSAATVEVEIRNDAVKCSSAGRDLDFVLMFFHSRKQLLSAVGATEQSIEILGVL